MFPFVFDWMLSQCQVHSIWTIYICVFGVGWVDVVCGVLWRLVWGVGWKWQGVLCGWAMWSVVDGSAVCAMLCGAVWCVRMIEVMGCDIQGGMWHSGSYIDVLYTWCVLRCSMPYTMCCTEHRRCGSVGYGIIWCCIFCYFFEVPCSLSPVNTEGNISSCKLIWNQVTLIYYLLCELACNIIFLWWLQEHIYVEGLLDTEWELDVPKMSETN